MANNSVELNLLSSRGQMPNPEKADMVHIGVDAAGTLFGKLSDGTIIELSGLFGMTNINCAADPNCPVSKKGQVYRVTGAGKFGGASGEDVDVDDLIYTITANATAGDWATCGSHFYISQGNIDLTTLTEMLEQILGADSEMTLIKSESFEGEKMVLPENVDAFSFENREGDAAAIQLGNIIAKNEISNIKCIAILDQKQNAAALALKELLNTSSEDFIDIKKGDGTVGGALRAATLYYPDALSKLEVKSDEGSFGSLQVAGLVSQSAGLAIVVSDGGGASGKFQLAALVAPENSTSIDILDEAEDYASLNVRTVDAQYVTKTTGEYVAYAGGGAGNATLLGAQVNIIKTCATLNDSVLLPNNTDLPLGTIIEVINWGAQNAKMYINAGKIADATQWDLSDYTLLAGSSYKFILHLHKDVRTWVKM